MVDPNEVEVGDVVECIEISKRVDDYCSIGKKYVIVQVGSPGGNQSIQVENDKGNHWWVTNACFVAVKGNGDGFDTW